MTFLNQPKLELVGDGEYLLEEDYVYQWGIHLGREHRLTVPEGFSTDIATIPWYLRSSGFGPDGLHRAAAVLHDFLYYHKGKIPNTKVGGSYEVLTGAGPTWKKSLSTWSRKQVDKLFLQVMKEAGVKWYKRKTMYWAVRAFGKSYWDN